MKFNAEHKMVMKTAFSNYNRLVELEQEDYLDRLFAALKEKGELIAFDRGNDDFRDFAIEGYIRNMRKLCDEWEQILNAIKTTRQIADFGLIDDEDEDDEDAE